MIKDAATIEEVEKSIFECMDYMENEVKEVMKDIKRLLKESEDHSKNSAYGYDEGWYNGECNAYEIVLEKLEELF